MDSSVIEILKRQQILETFKSSGYEKETEINSTQYGQNILRVCRTSSFKRNKYRKKLTAACAFAIVAALFSAANVGYIWIRNGIATSNARPAYLEPDPDVDNSSDDYYSTSVPCAEAAMEAGDYTNAKKILDSKKERNENTFAGALTYSELYNKTGDYDNAALVILNFLDKHYPPVNIHSQSPLYTDLQDIKGELSPDVQERYDTCMTECKASAAFYDHLDSLVKQEDYQTALDLCNSRKQEGAFDSTLFTYYDYCYMGLEKYEEFADYLMEIIKNYPSDVYSMIKVPSDDAVTSGINKVYPYLSAEKKREIDNLHVLTNTADTSE